MLDAVRNHRPFCWTCRQVRAACFCHSIQAFDPGLDFVILIHPLESRRRIATGRMAHLHMPTSHLIEGEDFSDHSRLKKLLAREDREHLVLYPSSTATDITEGPRALFESRPLAREKRLMVYLIDGTWATARKMMRLSGELKALPAIRFTPKTQSRFEVRKQPEAHCLSTLEAIHTMIDLLGGGSPLDDSGKTVHDSSSTLISPRERPHDALLEVFLEMVKRQKSFLPIEQPLRASNPRALAIE